MLCAAGPCLSSQLPEEVVSAPLLPGGGWLAVSVFPPLGRRFSFCALLVALSVERAATGNIEALPHDIHCSCSFYLGTAWSLWPFRCIPQRMKYLFPSLPQPRQVGRCGQTVYVFGALDFGIQAN